MKNIISITAVAVIIFVMLLPLTSYSQTPEKMSFQTVIRDASGELLSESPAGIQISILQDSAGGAAVFVETHSAMTNVNGLASLEIGMGTMITGTFADIDWSNGPFFIKTEVDPDGGTNYSMSSTSQLLSVPYAMHATTAEKIDGPLEISMDADDPTSNFPLPWENEGAFVATFENTNTDKGDGIKIKLGKQRTEIIPEITFTQTTLDDAQQILDLLDSSKTTNEKQDILEQLILDGIQADAETVAGLAIGAGNLITGFINDGLGLPLDVGLEINDEVGLPWNFTEPINDALDLPWNLTQPINSTMGLPYIYDFPLDIGEVTCMPALPDVVLPEIPDASIPGFPESTVVSGYEYTCTTATPTPWVDDFENPDQTIWQASQGSLFQSYANPVVDAMNPSAAVLCFQDLGGLDNSRLTLLRPQSSVGVFDHSEYHTYSVMVYPVAELGSDTATNITMQFMGPWRPEITKPLVPNQWQTITFDWLNDAYQTPAEGDPDPGIPAVDYEEFGQIRFFFNKYSQADQMGDIFVCLDNFSWDGTYLDIKDEIVPEDTFCEYSDTLAFVSQTFTEQQTDFRIPEIPTIPEFTIGDVTITPVDPRNLEFWGIVNFDFTEINTEALSNENEFIRFSDADDSKMGSIRAQSKLNWAKTNLNPLFLKKVRGITKGTMDKKHMRTTLSSMLAEKAWSYSKLGVEYSSSFGDYAEWLERANPDEQMRPGSIVGVAGGKISKDLTDAEQVMVVSHNPIVLGNVPKEESTHLGNNIAFVGQVPVKIMGSVQTGDYIIGNPATPGYGYAKSPEDIGIEELRFAVGRSWEDSEDEGPKMVNTVVGVHNGDYVNIIKNQAQKLQSAEERLKSLESNMESVLQILSVEANNK